MATQHDNGESTAAQHSPTVVRVALGSHLRRLREDRRISRESAGEAIRGSHAKISRLELGRTGFKERDIRDLLTLYGVLDSDTRDVYLDMARSANEPGWWHPYGDVLPAWFETYLGLEQAAATIRTYEAQLIPGLLQTKAYARAVIALGGHRDIERRVDMRMRRQQILTRNTPPMLWAVLDETALRRPIGGVHTQRDQIEHLIQVAQVPTVKLQILPYAAGGHAAVGCPFSILRFHESELPDVVYLEQLTSSLYLEKRAEVEQYMSVMNTFSVQALPPKKSTDFLTALLTEINH